MLYSVLIVGAGNIGAFFDTPHSKAVFSHAHAFSTHPGFRISGFVDTENAKAVLAANLWGGNAYESIEDALASGTIDVVVVAVPDEYHYPLLKELARYPLKLVFAEKPLTKTVAQSEEIIGLFQQNGIRLAVNYSRRFVPELAELRVRIADGAFGKYVSGTGYYGKGTLHNGSHMVDLVRFLVGDIREAQTVSHLTDFYDDDPSCSAVLTFAEGDNFFMQAVDCRNYTIFELDLFFERQRVRMTNAGFRIELHEVRDNAVFAGYRNIELSTIIDTQLDNALYAAVDNIHEHLAANSPLLCNGEDGCKAMALCCRLLQAVQ